MNFRAEIFQFTHWATRIPKDDRRVQKKKKQQTGTTNIYNTKSCHTIYQRRMNERIKRIQQRTRVYIFATDLKLLIFRVVWPKRKSDKRVHVLNIKSESFRFLFFCTFTVFFRVMFFRWSLFIDESSRRRFSNYSLLHLSINQEKLNEPKRTGQWKRFVGFVFFASV